MIKWFAANKLVLNLDKTNIMQFITKDTTHSTLCIGYTEKYIEETVNTKFLGLQTDNHLNWKKHNEKMSPKLSGEQDAIRLMVHVSDINTLKKIYYVYFHSVTKYGIIFGVTLPTVGRFRLTPPPPKENHQNYGWCTSLQVIVYLNSLRFYLFHANIYFT